MMASGTSKQSYPDELNPFDDEDTTPTTDPSKNITLKAGYYPERLNPFDDDHDKNGTDDHKTKADDYDDSFNPFATEATTESSTVNPHSSMSTADYDSSLNPFDEDQTEGQASEAEQSQRHSSSIFPPPQTNLGPNRKILTKSSISQPHLTVSSNLHPRRSSPVRPHKKRAAPRPPIEPSPGHCDEQAPSSLAPSNIDDKAPLQSAASHSDDNPSLSYSSIQSSSSSQIIPEAQQASGSSHKAIENSDTLALTVSSNQPDQITSISSEPTRVPSPAIRRSLNSINRSSSSLSSHRDSPSAQYPSCHSHDGSLSNVSDDFRPVPLPRTRSLLKKEAKLAANISCQPSKNLKEKLENLETEQDPKEKIESETTSIDRPTTNGLDIDRHSIQSHEVSTNNHETIVLESGRNDKSVMVVLSEVEADSSVEKNTLVENDRDKHIAETQCKSNSGSSKSLSEENSSDKNAALWRKIGLKKRAAPPLPVNYKRQVFGSLVEIEEELNEIGDNLVDIEKKSLACRMEIHEERLRDKDAIDISSHSTQKFIELVKEKCNLARRQKELMYRKREHILDQSHSDIEYELRMICNKQASHRTEQDDLREQELLKRLVEIIEEKNDIVENLIRDSSISDEEELEEALRRLDINFPTIHSPGGDREALSSKGSDRNSITSAPSKPTSKSLSNGGPEASKQQDKNSKIKHRATTTKALKTLKKYGKVVVKMSKTKEENND